MYVYFLILGKPLAYGSAESLRFLPESMQIALRETARIRFGKAGAHPQLDRSLPAAMVTILPLLLGRTASNFHRGSYAIDVPQLVPATYNFVTGLLSFASPPRKFSAAVLQIPAAVSHCNMSRNNTAASAIVRVGTHP